MKTTHGPRRRASGFTLIEVMVALAIVAITLSAGIKAAGSLANNAERFTDTSIAQWCADNELTDLTINRPHLSVGVSDFDCQQLGRTYHGKLMVQSTSATTNFWRVDVRVLTEDDQPVLLVSTVMRK